MRLHDLESARRYRRRIWLAATAAFSVHAMAFLAAPKAKPPIKAPPDVPPSIDVEFVDPPEPIPEPPREEPPPPAAPKEEPPPPEPEPPKEQPPPDPPKKEEPMRLPEPKKEPPKPVKKPSPPPKVEPRPEPPRTVRPTPPPAPRPAVAPSPPAPRVTAQPRPASPAKGGPTRGVSYGYRPKPAYPPESRQAREQGTVLVRVSVGPDGRPTSVSLARSSGFPRLDSSALEVVRRWRFRPALRNGAPVAGVVNAPVEFRLR